MEDLQKNCIDLQHEKELKAIASFKLMDDTFLSAAFDGQIKETELLIRTILEREDIDVIRSESQYYLSNLYGREVKLDILAKDRAGRAYNFEVQRDMSGSSVQRARFNGAMVDVTLLKKGQNVKEIPDRYTIFITETDKFKRGLPIYHAENTIRELEHEPLGDGGHILYVNGEYQNTDTPVGQLMHDFFCENSEDMINPLLKERVYYLKETEGGRNHMCKIMDDLTKDRINEDKIDSAKKAIAQGKLNADEISEILGLPIEVIKELESEVVPV